MFARLLGTARADIDRQIGWLKDEAQRQARHTALVGALAIAAALATLGAIIVGLIALYAWLETQTDPLTALGILGGGLLVLALILFALAFASRRPPLAPRPPVQIAQQIAQPAALLGTLRQGGHAKFVGDNEEALSAAANAIRLGSRSELLGTLIVAAVVGLIVARRL
jgi:hypothetical protein